MSELDWTHHDSVRAAADGKYAAEIKPSDLQEYDETMTNMAKLFRSYGMDLEDPVVLHTMYGMLSTGVWLMTREASQCPEGKHIYGHLASYAASIALFLREQVKYTDGVPSATA